MPQPSTLNEVVIFCQNNRKTRGFKSYSFDQIATDVVNAACDNRLLVVVDDIGICGVCIYTPRQLHVYIHHIIAVRNGFPTMVEECKKRFPGKEIYGRRKGILRKFNQNKLWAMFHQAQEMPQGKSSNHYNSTLPTQ